jgi:hypothetical protein
MITYLKPCKTLAIMRTGSEEVSQNMIKLIAVHNNKSRRVNLEYL